MKSSGKRERLRLLPPTAAVVRFALLVRQRFTAFRALRVGGNPRTDGYCSNGSDERRYAMEYYERVG